MGIVRMGPPEELTQLLRDIFDIDYFVETGTFLGQTTCWASQLFNHVITIEYSEKLYQDAINKYQDIENITFLFGDTRTCLKQIVPELQTPSLFWLDAHWCGGVTYGETDECPLLEELEIINQSSQNHFILIDDARLFISPPPLPHQADAWPDIAQVLVALNHPSHQRHVVIFEDVVIAVPVAAKALIINYLQRPVPPPPPKPTQSASSVVDASEISVIKNFIQSGNIVFDIGANVGEWTQSLLSLTSNVQVHLFEPTPRVYQTLLKNLADQIKLDNLFLNNCAVSSQELLKKFFSYKNALKLNTFYRRVDIEQQFDLGIPQEFPVPSVTLDSYTTRLGIKHIHFLKIDTEGSELDVLQGAESLLQHNRIDYLQFEYGGTYLDAGVTLKQAYKYLDSFGYKLFKLTQEGLVYLPDFLEEYEDYNYSNYLAVRQALAIVLTGQAIEMLNLQKLCHQYGIRPRGVIHVGAYEGLEAARYRDMSIQQVVFVEANPAVFARLQQNLVGYPGMQAVNCAISNQEGEAQLRVTSMDQSSSLLPLKLHQEIYPSIQETEQIQVKTKTLDRLLQELQLGPEDFNLLNIDIQGAELLALQGATNLLKHVDAINTEVNFEELYEGCALIEQVDEFLASHGFHRVATITPYHPSWGDAFYVRQPVITMSTLGINGRFGNQFFQYAFLKTYAQKYNLQVETAPWIGQLLFGCQDAPVSRRLPVVLEQTNRLEKATIPYSDFKNVDFWGYFQFHSQYYAPHKEYLRSLFTPTPEVAARLEPALEQLRSRGQTLIGLHLRRGDYGHSIFPIAPSEWYREWLRGFWETLDQPVLFIASDEPEKVVADFADYNPMTTADLGIDFPEAPFYPDFYLLSQCDAVAISNSSFSYAACWLNERAKFFYRPHFPSQKLIPFDPWNSDLWPSEIDNDTGFVDTLNYLRRELKEFWQRTPDQELANCYQDQKGTWQWVAQHSFLRFRPVPPEVETFVTQLKTELTVSVEQPGGVQRLLVALLYCPVHELPRIPPEQLPSWLRRDFQNFLTDEVEEQQQTDAFLRQELRLRDINLIVCPDWSQPEEMIAAELWPVLQTIACHPHRSQITLLVDGSSAEAETADLVISGLAIDLVMNDERDAVNFEIALVPRLSDRQWYSLLALLRGRVTLLHADSKVARDRLLNDLPTLTLEELATFQRHD